MPNDHKKATPLASAQQEGLDVYEHARTLLKRMGITSVQEAKRQAIGMTPKELRLIFPR